MATEKTFSFAAFCEYGNACINGKDSEIQSAFKTDLKAAIKKAGYPSKDEINVIDEINDFDISNTLATVPKMVAGFMHDEKRSFNIPSVDKNTTPATIKVVAVEKKSEERIGQFGENKGKPYTTVTEAHEELKVKNNRSAFKK